MRVAIIYDCLFPETTGGGERVYGRLADALRERGIAVDYLTRDFDSPAAHTFAVIPVWRGPIGDGDGNRSVASAVRFAARVYRAMRSRRADYDIVIASALPVLTLLAARAALRGSSAYVVADWLEVWTWRKWRRYSGVAVGSIAFALQWVGSRAAQLHTVNSRFTAARLLRYRPGARPIVLGLLDSVADPGPAEPTIAAAPPIIPVEPIILVESIILAVGRLIPDKRIDSLPSALREVRAVRPGARLVVVGDGPEASTIRRAAETAGVASSMRIAGRVSDAELAELMASAAVLVNPSAREGYGLVVAEAASFGTPSVVVDSEDNAAVELIVPGENGYVAASTSPRHLADGILSALDGGAALRVSTLAWFRRERVVSSLDRSIDEILARYLAARRSD